MCAIEYGSRLHIHVIPARWGLSYLSGPFSGTSSRRRDGSGYGFSCSCIGRSRRYTAGKYMSTVRRIFGSQSSSLVALLLTFGLFICRSVFCRKEYVIIFLQYSPCIHITLVFPHGSANQCVSSLALLSYFVIVCHSEIHAQHAAALYLILCLRKARTQIHLHNFEKISEQHKWLMRLCERYWRLWE